MRPVLFACGLLCSAVLSAQPFERTVRRNFWNDGINAAGLRCDSVSVSNAELSALYYDGAYRNISDPQRGFDAAAVARTITHLKKFSMAGSFGFTQREWKNACGSMLMDEDGYPFNTYEFTPGDKTFQIFDMSGALSVDVSAAWRVGAALDFESANAAKKRDLRYQGYLMKMSVAPSVQYHKDGFALGASVIFRRDVQIVTAEQIGSTSGIPFTFFDEGAMTGYYQEWTGGLSRLKESGVSGFPTSRNELGFGLQTQVGSLYADVEFSTFGAAAGEKQIVWYRYGGEKVKVGLGWRSGMHSVRAGFNWERLSNYRTILDKSTTGGITTTVEYGSNLLMIRNRIGASLEYELLIRGWEARLKAELYDKNENVVPMYPYVYRRSVDRWKVELEAVRHLGSWDIGASAFVSPGSMKDYSELPALQSGITSTVNTLLIAKPELYYQFSDYLCAFRYGGSLRGRYNFRRGLYVEISGGTVLGRWRAGMALGYNF